MAGVIIAGGGLAGARTAETLRESGFSGDITILAGESHLPYDRPPLSKGYLKGEAELDEVELHDQAWYDEHKITVKSGTLVTEIVPAEHQIVTDGGDRVDYDQLVLATGSSARQLDLPGANLKGVLYLRTLEDSNVLKSALSDAGSLRLAVIGGGWIGLEVTSAFADAGAKVTVLETQEQPLQNALGTEMGAFFAKLHRSHGVDLRTEVAVESIQPNADGAAVGSVKLTDGTEIPADLVLIGIGATPNVEFARAAGLTVDNGVVVDKHGRTSEADIFATGDIANYPDRVLGRLRVEHQTTAITHPLAVATAITGGSDGYDERPFFYSDQYDLGLEYAGRGAPGDQLVIRGDQEKAEFIAFWLRDNKLTAGMNVNVWDVSEQIAELISNETIVDPVKLADPEVPLDQVAADK
ncbi:MAG: FAD/NAD(P)-binding oxidoreductase [Antricoccus sp.]